MADSLGEKLRLAREERDITISEVAEQTRISALYLQAIEKDDYRTLPGGIFNKGFVKSFAKYVGVDEHEALQDYASIIAKQEGSDSDSDPPNYRPKVLTDDSRRGSMLPTIIFAVIILGLMAWGIHTLVKYVQSLESSTSGADSLNAANVKTNESPATNTNTNAVTNEALPAMDSIKVNITTTADELSVVSMADGRRETFVLSASLKEKVIEAEERLELNYYQGLADTVSLELNGRKIAAPVVPENYRKNGLIFEINMDNIKKILQDGKIVIGGTGNIAVNTNSNTAANTNTATAPDTNTGNAQ